MKIIIGNGKVCDNIKEDGDVVLVHKDIEISNIDSFLRRFFEDDQGTKSQHGPRRI
jgi:hypothetical protein